MARNPERVGGTDVAKTAADGVAERRKAAEAANAETERRMAAGRPTPTQEECDLAKVGALALDDKEDDGSGPEPDPRLRTLAPAELSAGGYTTRTAVADAPRGPGRPRKDET